MTDRSESESEVRRVLLPHWNEILGGYSCAKLYCDAHPAFECGCPICLHHEGLTLIFVGDDWDTLRDKRIFWKKVCPEKVALMAPELIVPGYAGSLKGATGEIMGPTQEGK